MYALNAAVALLACASSAMAMPKFGFGAGNGCLTKDTAEELVNNFIKLTNGDGFNENLARSIIRKDLVDTSGSVGSVINSGGVAPVPLLGPTLVGRADFIEANAAQASTPYEALNIYWTCDVITFRFKIAEGPFAVQPVLGISILETVPAPKGNKHPFQIKTVYGELNSFAFLVDLGVYEPLNITAPPAPERRSANFRRDAM
ncbi:hypothetical protein LTR37_012622 [Vermiconidia calcicola]|uniref:Uncharacterized protein n=1 Tax=Vermiconidia calcicola TaxID=1690605 RepID=A0ACC3MYZ8_9PEZI|nr:hypothetical protein LTR37_012622 [Vermiconidia calcicola]